MHSFNSSRQPLTASQLWFQLDWQQHPDAKIKSIIEIENDIFLACIEKGVLVARGSWFAANKAEFHPTDMFFRATFAAASEERMTEAIERFAIALKESFKLDV